MKSLFVVLFMFASSMAYAQSYSCNVRIGYACQEDFFFAGVFSRQVMCVAYGEEIVSIDEAEQEKIFASKNSCEDISVTESECSITRNFSEKFCAETGGDYNYLDKSCLHCKNQ
ncbi:hypothetical protein [Pseudobdellovibrio sp. HCB154]|uniref:hypothetical protein n=1 Tax=Pseudobdellovibrio sp. HCB154 TaxID=3386277 RepID=UPI003916EDC7